MSVLSGALMKVIGLTGGIASGKSTVSSHLRSLGASVIDADKVAWELAEPGKAIWQAYRHRYGDEVINEDGTLKDDRVIEDLHKAIDMYENGEIVETHDILLYIVNAIRKCTIE